MQAKIKTRGAFTEMLVNYCFEYRQTWHRRGYATPIMDRLIFGGMKALVGGRMHTMLSGGAPLSEDAHHYIR